MAAMRRMPADRVGKANAITATARKLAILVHRTLKDGLVYHDPGAAAYDAQHRQRVIRRLRQSAANLGFALVDRGTGELRDPGLGRIRRHRHQRRHPRSLPSPETVKRNLHAAWRSTPEPRHANAPLRAFHEVTPSDGRDRPWRAAGLELDDPR
jgi:hypothetical protein